MGSFKNINYKKVKTKLGKIIKSDLINKGDRILIAFSGGPDSVFLYHVMEYLKEDFKLKISLLYVNHNLRTDIKKDLEFIKKFSKKKGVTLYIENVDVNAHALEKRKSVELAARELRYEKLYEVMHRINYNKIATGHNLDDNVETVVFRLLRGTSIRGLKGIPRKRDNIIRPMLEFEKSEILDFLDENNEKYITDYTNNQNDYTRNYIRNELFPMFLRINPDFRKKVHDLIKEINNRGNETGEIENSKKRLIFLMEENGVSLSRQKIDQIYYNFFEQNGNLKKEGNKEFNLGNGKLLRKIYNKLEIVKESNCNSHNEEMNKIQLKKNQSIEWYTYEVGYFKNIDKLRNLYLYDKKEYRECVIFKFDREEDSNGRLIIRKREDGDRIFISRVGNQKIKKILIDKKIPKWERDKIPIIELEKKDEQIILAVGNIKKCGLLKKIQLEDIEKLQKNESILVIRRKDERQR